MTNTQPDKARSQARELVSSASRTTDKTESSDAGKYDLDKIIADGLENDVKLKQTVHRWVSGLIISQVVASDLLILGYMLLVWLADWDFHENIVQWWIAGAVVQIVGLGYVIVRYLFQTDGVPLLGRNPNPSAREM